MEKKPGERIVETVMKKRWEDSHYISLFDLAREVGVILDKLDARLKALEQQHGEEK